MAREVTGIVKMEVDGVFGEEEMAHLSKELDWAVAAMWDGDTILPSGNEHTHIGYRGVEVYDGKPKAVGHLSPEGFSLLHSQTPLEMMLIDSSDPELDQVIQRTPADELSVMPVEVQEFDKPESEYGLFEFHEITEDGAEEAAEYFEFARDPEMITSYAESLKRYVKDIEN